MKVMILALCGFAMLAFADEKVSPNVHLTKNRMQRLGKIAEKMKEKDGAYPKDATWIKEPDAWNRRFIYKSDGQHFTLMSLGKDGKEGGVGEDMDIVSSDAKPGSP